MKKQSPIMVSLFTGAGGLDEGFKAAGCEIKACLELESWACETLNFNNPTTNVIQGNIKEISPKEFSNMTKLKPYEIDILAGGPPCQPFSVAASQRFLKSDDLFKRKGFDDEEKGTLLFNFVEYIKWFKPKVFVLENVSGLLTIDNGKQLLRCLKELEEIGYAHTVPSIMNAVDYGVPQFRKRCIIWGTLEKGVVPLLPEQTHFKDKAPYWRTASQALIDVDKDDINNIAREHKAESIQRYQRLSFGERDQRGRVDRINPDLPSKTIIAGGLKGGGRSHLHPFIPRTMTARECARIQTFDDSYKFKGSIARQFTQVGNAVPPLLAECLARQILSTVFSFTFKNPPKHESFVNRYNSEEATEILRDKSKDDSGYIQDL